MKKRSVSLAEVNKLDPSLLIYACWVGSDDILVVDGVELIKMAKEDSERKKITLAQAVEFLTKDQSGNSFEFILIEDGKPVKLLMDWPEE